MFERKEFKVGWLRAFIVWCREVDRIDRFDQLPLVKRRLERQLVEQAFQNRPGWRAVLGYEDYDRCMELGIDPLVTGVHVERGTLARGIDWHAPPELEPFARAQQLSRESLLTYHLRQQRGREALGNAMADMVRERLMAPPKIQFPTVQEPADTTGLHPPYEGVILRGARPGVTGLQGYTGIQGVTGPGPMGPNRNGDMFPMGVGPIEVQLNFDYSRYEQERREEQAKHEPKINRRIHWIAGVEPEHVEQPNNELVAAWEKVNNNPNIQVQVQCGICGSEFGTCIHTRAPIQSGDGLIELSTINDAIDIDYPGDSDNELEEINDMDDAVETDE